MSGRRGDVGAEETLTHRLRRKAAEHRSGPTPKACRSREAEGMRYKVSSGDERRWTVRLAID